MALICDIESENQEVASQETADLEDGEITDDDEDTQQLELNKSFEEESTVINSMTASSVKKSPSRDGKEVRERSSDRERFSDERDRKEKRGKERGREDKSHRHMTEAEKSILHLRKREKMLREREKWEKQHRKDIDTTENADDDFAKNIEKTLATILHKREKEAAALSAGEEGKDIEKRGKKRKKHDKDKDRSKKNKRSADASRQEIDENEILNMRSGSPSIEMRLPPIGLHGSQQGISKSDESISDYSSDERDERLRRRAKSRRKKETRERNRREREQRRLQEQSSKVPLQDSQGVCVFYMQGKCQKNDCPYSHEVTPPMKLELCKFYLMDCCAKGDKCSYMHSEFPCKFYHTGLQCHQGDNCKFAHGPALSDGLKQILFKHIETAPRDILGGFPRLSREEALNLIDETQQKLLTSYNDQNSSSNYGNSSKQEYGSQNSACSVMMYGNRYPNFDNRDDNDREKEPSKGGIPSLFDITVPMPPELATALDFETKTPKNRIKQSRWQQDTDSKTSTFYTKPFSYGADQDMRINSNGDIDMRTLPALHNISIASPSSKDISPAKPKFDQYTKDGNKKNNVDFTKDIDIGHPPPGTYPISTSMDVDIRQIPKMYEDKHHSDTEDELHIDTGEDKRMTIKQPPDLPQTTKDLIARISATQKDNTIDSQSSMQSASSSQPNAFDSDQNINWYSDDDDDDENRLTIKVEDEEGFKRERADSLESISGNEKDCPTEEGPISESNSNSDLFDSKTADIVGKLGDLSKIDISAEVTKLLTSMSKNRSQPSTQDNNTILSDTVNSQDIGASSSGGSQDPRLARQDPRLANSNSQETPTVRQDPRLVDPRQRPRQNSTETQDKDKKLDKVSIYEQGGLDMKKAALDIDGDDIKTTRPDIDLRQLSLPFKGMQNYTPATEIDASVNSHPPIIWKVYIVEIPRPDYTGLKLSISDAEKTGDPRLRKIFRLCADEKDSPMSPKASPKHGSGIRADPRLRKMEEKSQENQQSSQMSYSQQLNMLQSSQFYQSLTSNQKLMLNQELSSRCDQNSGSGLHDPVLNTLLSNLNLLPQNSVSNQQSSLPANNNLGAALAILANVTKLNPIMPNQPLIGQQGLLGAAPGIPNLPPQLSQEYPINFDPRNGGLLGNAPPAPFGQFGGNVESPFSGGYNDDFYGGYDDQGPNMGPQGGNFRQGRGYNNNNRDGRRRGRNFGGRGRNFKRGGRGDRDGRGERDRDGGRPIRGHSPV